MSEHILSLSYGKDSLACIYVIKEVLRWPLDRIVHAEVWATDTIPADLPPMVEFKTKADRIIKERWGIEVEHYASKKVDKVIADKVTYENYFYQIMDSGKNIGTIKGFPMQHGGYISRRDSMKIGLIDVDGHNYPNLALMKISAYHKAQGDTVEWCFPFYHYDIVYQSKVFDDTYSPDISWEPWADKIIKGGTGYGLDNRLPDEVEHMYPDYSLYPDLTEDTAYGFLTRGCPRACDFCIVAAKEGRRSVKVADLSEFWRGQKNIVLMDPNILACREHPDLLRQLIDSGAYVDFNQGLDIRMTAPENIALINQVKVKNIHFAWDRPADDLKPFFERYKQYATHKIHGKWGTVYVLTNHGSTLAEDLYRIYNLRDMGFNPYVMVYDKPNAPAIIKRLQRWVNNKIIFGSCRKFEDYK